MECERVEMEVTKRVVLKRLKNGEEGFMQTLGLDTMEDVIKAIESGRAVVFSDKERKGYLTAKWVQES